MSNFVCSGIISEVGSWGISLYADNYYLTDYTIDFVWCPVLKQYFCKLVCDKICRKRKCRKVQMEPKQK